MASALAAALMLSLCGRSDETTKDTDDDEIVSENNDKNKDKENSEDDFEYKFDVTAGGNIITKYKGKEKNIIIPDTIGGERIVDISLRENEDIEYVSLSKGLTKIGVSAFQNCTSLTSVKIGKGVTLIGDCAFYDCTDLKNISIPDSIQYLAGDAFIGCDKAKITYKGNTYDCNTIYSAING